MPQGPEEDWAERRRIEHREQKPLRGSFREFHGGRPELTGTSEYGANWLTAQRPGVSRFEGRLKKKDLERERATYGAGRGFGISMVTNNFPGSITSTNYGGTTHNYGMSGLGPVEGGAPDAPYEGPPAVSFAAAEPAEPSMWGEAKEIAGGAVRSAGRMALGGVARGASAVASRWSGARAKGTQLPAVAPGLGFNATPGEQDSLF